MRHLVAVGACYLDTILTVERYPAEDEKLRASSVSQRRGGNCPNTLEVLQQLLLLPDSTNSGDVRDPHQPSPVLFAVLPSASSPAVRRIESSFGPSVDLSRCLYREDHTEPASSYIIKSLAEDSRTIVNYNGLPEMTSEEFVAMTADLDADESWFHFEGRIPEVTLECLEHLRARHPSAKISVEVEKPGRPGLQELAALADVVFYSKSWAQGQGYQAPEDCLEAQRHLTPKASLLCCTWGSDGAVALETSTAAVTRIPAYVSGDHKVVDTIGAGDTFIAGMLYGLARHADDWDVPRKLAFANELAGRKVVRDGFDGLGRVMRRRVLEGTQ